MMWRRCECKSTRVKLISRFGFWCSNITLLLLVLLYFHSHCSHTRTNQGLYQMVRFVSHGLRLRCNKHITLGFCRVWEQKKSLHMPVCRVYMVVARLVNRCVCAGIDTVTSVVSCDEACWCVSYSLWSTTSCTEPTQPLQHEAPIWHNSLPSEKPLCLGYAKKKTHNLNSAGKFLFRVIPWNLA